MRESCSNERNRGYSLSPMGARWTDFLHHSSAREHAVQIYADIDELGDSVAAYLALGFELGEPAVVVTRPEHLARFADKLATLGWDSERVEAEGLLTVADAERTLEAFMEAGSPNADAFEQVVGGLVDGVAKRFPEGTIRTFGEMVDILSARGEVAAAIELEELWNKLARTRRFSLLCGYHLDIFDHTAQTGALPHVCRVHSHVKPIVDNARFARAVDAALEEVLGANGAGKVYVVIGDQIRENRVPIAQLALMWVSENMPALAGRVLDSARAHYASA